MLPSSPEPANSSIYRRTRRNQAQSYNNRKNKDLPADAKSCAIVVDIGIIKIYAKFIEIYNSDTKSAENRPFRMGKQAEIGTKSLKNVKIRISAKKVSTKITPKIVPESQPKQPLKHLRKAPSPANKTLRDIFSQELKDLGREGCYP